MVLNPRTLFRDINFFSLFVLKPAKMSNGPDLFSRDFLQILQRKCSRNFCKENATTITDEKGETALLRAIIFLWHLWHFQP